MKKQKKNGKRKMKKTETNKNEKQKKIKDISLVKIGPVTAEIFQIWVNVARTNVAWTNVTVTVQ